MLAAASWGLIAAISVVDCAWLAVERLHVVYWGLLPFLMILLPFAVLAKRAKPQLAHRLNGFALNIASTSALAIFVYVCATADLPLRDAWLVTVDRHLGFNWLALYYLVASSHSLLVTLAFNYFFAFIIQSTAFFLLLPVINPARNLELALTTVISVVTCALIAVILPAKGPIFYFGVHPDPLIHKGLIAALRTFTALRHGTVTDLAALNGGIIVFPSFHAAAAIIYTHAVRGSGHLFRVVATMNGFMLVSVPFIGGHYFADILAGALVGAFAIAVVGWLSADTQDRVAPVNALAASIKRPMVSGL